MEYPIDQKIEAELASLYARKRELEILREKQIRVFFARLVGKGWQKFKFYSEDFSGDYGDREQIYYFAPEVQIPQFGEFGHSGHGQSKADDAFDEFLNSLKENEFYEE